MERIWAISAGVMGILLLGGSALSYSSPNLHPVPASSSSFLLQTPTPTANASVTPTSTPWLPTLATLTPTVTPQSSVRFLSPDWIAMDKPGSPGGGLLGAYCLDELRCWFGVYSSSAVPPYSNLYHTADGGRTWETIAHSTQQTFFGIYFLDESHGFSGGFYSQDGGRTWDRVVVEGEPLVGTKFINKGIGYGCSNGSTFKTRDSGETWQRWAAPCPPGGAVFVDENIAWALGRGNALTYTTDGWGSQHEVSIGLDSERFSALDFLDYRRGWVGGAAATNVSDSRRSEAVLYRTTDAGQTWERLPLSPTYASVSLVDFVNERIGWVVAFRPTTLESSIPRYGADILRSDDGGNTWKVEVEITRRPGCVDCWLSFGFLYFLNERVGWATFGQWNPIVCCYYTLYKHSTGVALTPTPTPTPTPGPRSRESFVWRTYWDTLCRSPEQSGYLFWLNSSLGIDQIRSELLDSSEGHDVQTVRRLYVEVLARDPMIFEWDFVLTYESPFGGDCSGLRGWLRSGLSLEEIQAGLAASPEGQRVGAVRALYLELLGRDPLGRDKAGLRFWVELPWPLNEIRRAILESPEYQRRAGG